LTVREAILISSVAIYRLKPTHANARLHISQVLPVEPGTPTSSGTDFRDGTFRALDARCLAHINTIGIGWAGLALIKLSISFLRTVCAYWAGNT
jgi:hypothetical protein